MLVDAADHDDPPRLWFGEPSDDARAAAGKETGRSEDGAQAGAEAPGRTDPVDYEDEDQRETGQEIRLIDLVADLAREYSWPHDYWRRIGWLEFLAWIKATNRRRSGGDGGGDPGRWDDQTSQNNVADFDAERRRLRGY